MISLWNLNQKAAIERRAIWIVYLFQCFLCAISGKPESFPYFTVLFNQCQCWSETLSLFNILASMSVCYWMLEARWAALIVLIMQHLRFHTSEKNFTEGRKVMIVFVTCLCWCAVSLCICYTYMYIYVDVYMYACVYVFMYVYMYIYVRTYKCVCVCRDVLYCFFCMFLTIF